MVIMTFGKKRLGCSRHPVMEKVRVGGDSVRDVSAIMDDNYCANVFRKQKATHSRTVEHEARLNYHFSVKFVAI